MQFNVRAVGERRLQARHRLAQVVDGGRLAEEQVGLLEPDGADPADNCAEPVAGADQLVFVERRRRRVQGEVLGALLEQDLVEPP